MSKRTDKKKLVSCTLVIAMVIMLTSVAYRAKTGFDEELSGKEAIIVSAFATIHYEKPLGRDTDIVTRLERVVLTGNMAHFDDMPMIEIRLKNDRLAWISKREVVIE